MSGQDKWTLTSKVNATVTKHPQLPTTVMLEPANCGPLPIDCSMLKYSTSAIKGLKQI